MKKESNYAIANYVYKKYGAISEYNLKEIAKHFNFKENVFIRNYNMIKEINEMIEIATK